MTNKKSTSEQPSSAHKVYSLNRNGEFSLNLNDTKTRKAVMSKISRFKNTPVTA